MIGICSRPASLADYALKVVAADDDGDIAGSVACRLLVKEAYESAGVEGWMGEREQETLEWQALVLRNMMASA